MSIWAIIPVKSLADSKQRLAHLLSAPERARLMQQLLRHVLDVLGEVPAIQTTLVISPDPTVHAIAAEYGVLIEPEAESAGLNTAVARGIARALAGGATGAVVLPADLPLLTVGDIEALLAPVSGSALRDGGRHDSRSAARLVICSDSAGDGTNGLLLMPLRPFTFHYGPGSFRLHVDEAQRRGTAVYVVRSPGLQLDLDTEQDWQRVQSLTVNQQFVKDSLYPRS